MTRIIAGAARGRRLAVPPAGTRPTSDRVRESLFSSLDSEWLATGTSWSQVQVLDLYAGSGAVGLEALSRGAARAVLVEKGRPAARVLSANVRAVGLPGAEVIVRDVAHLAGGAPPMAATLVFADPPYDVPAAAVRAALAGLADTGWIAPDALVIVERAAKDAEAPLPDAWDAGRRRTYGDTALWYGRVAPEAAAEVDRGDS